MGIVSNRFKNKAKTSGFTIVELVIVLVVISVLVSIGVMAYLGMNNRAAEIATETRLKNSHKQIEAHRTIYGQYPKTADCNLPVSVDNICLDDDGYQPSYDAWDDGFTVGQEDEPKKVIHEINQDGKITTNTMGWKQVSSNCGIYYDNKVYCWSGGSSAPTLIGGDLVGKNVKELSSGHGHTCALAFDGRAYCWGSNTWGGLGDGTTQNKSLPVEVKATTPEDALYGKTIKQISAGWGHTCAVASDNKAYCWGRNSAYELGIGSGAQTLKPKAVQGDVFNKTIKIVETGYGHSCAVTVDNELYCWGYTGAKGVQRFGFDTTDIDEKGFFNLPVLAHDSLLTEVELRYLTFSMDDPWPHNCAIDSGNKAYCWGYNVYGSLGDGVSVGDIRQINIKTENNGDQIKAISAGYRYTCAISFNDKAYCWGRNDQGQLGNGLKTDSRSPVAVGGELVNKTVTDISTNWRHTCAIADGDIYCWGSNSSGQLGDGTTIDSALPVKIKKPVR